MLRDSRLRQSNFLHQIGIDARLCLYKVLQNGNPRRVRNYFRNLSEFILLLGE
jgi:hypothetical protein